VDLIGFGDFSRSVGCSVGPGGIVGRAFLRGTADEHNRKSDEDGYFGANFHGSGFYRLIKITHWHPKLRYNFATDSYNITTCIFIKLLPRNSFEPWLISLIFAASKFR
jgi:hypothetical protein